MASDQQAGDSRGDRCGALGVVPLSRRVKYFGWLRTGVTAVRWVWVRQWGLAGSWRDEWAMGCRAGSIGGV